MLKSAYAQILCAGLAIFCSGAAIAAPFQNGSFELTNVSGTHFVNNGDASAITGWTAFTSSSSPNSVYISDAPLAYLPPATDGTQVVTLNNDVLGGTSSITQTFDTVAGQIYNVLFDLSREVGVSADAPQISVSATGNSAALFVASTAWVEHPYSFTATGSSTTLTFARISAGEGFSPVIDNVRVTAQPVPEPATVALWAMLGGLGLVALRLRKKSA